MSNNHDNSVSGKDYLDYFKRKVVETRTPLDGSLELTHRCNLKCVHCYLGNQGEIRKHRDRELTTREITDLIDDLAKAGTLNLTLTGGDPMVRKDFDVIYTHAVRSGMLVTVFCDGVLISDKTTALFRRYPPRDIEITLYGATRETYEGITQVNGSYQRCLAGIHRLKKNGIRFRLKTVLLTLNQHEFDAIQGMATELGVHFHYDPAIFPCLPCHDNHGESNCSPARRKVPAGPPAQPGNRAGKPAATVAPVNGERLRDPLSLRVDPQTVAEIDLGSPDKEAAWIKQYYRRNDVTHPERLYTCGAGLTTFHIDPYGNLHPCIIAARTSYKLKNGSFKEGWNGPLADFRKQIPGVHYTCNRCEKQHVCSGCPALFDLESGSPDIKSDYICQTTHFRFEKLRKLIRISHQADAVI